MRCSMDADRGFPVLILSRKSTDSSGDKIVNNTCPLFVIRTNPSDIPLK